MESLMWLLDEVDFWTKLAEQNPDPEAEPGQTPGGDEEAEIVEHEGLIGSPGPELDRINVRPLCDAISHIA